jgi:hypothetical protein
LQTHIIGRRRFRLAKQVRKWAKFPVSIHIRGHVDKNVIFSSSCHLIEYFGLEKKSPKGDSVKTDECFFLQAEAEKKWEGA